MICPSVAAGEAAVDHGQVEEHENKHTGPVVYNTDLSQEGLHVVSEGRAVKSIGNEWMKVGSAGVWMGSS